MKRLFIITATYFFLFTCLKAQICINEVMQSNIDCTMDDINEFPDSWVELFNISGSAIDLAQFKIGESSNPDKAWQLPSKSLTPHSFTLIYCDNEASGMHTDFRVDTGKGASLYLFRNNAIADSLIIPEKQPSPNISYGRLNEGSKEWGYQLSPTPNAKNCGTFAKGILGEPIFSMAGGVYTKTANRQLTLSIPDDAPKGTHIRYTLNGSEPTKESTVYTSPIPVSASRVVRAKLFCDGYLSPRSTTHSYLTLSREMTLPVISISTDDKYLNDNKIGIYIEGTYKSGKKNYEYNWRRPINFEFFDAPDAESQLNQLCEARVSGAASRGWKFKSLAIYAHKRFGTKRFKYEFFTDDRPGQTNFKSLVLRNAGNDCDYLYMRDAIAQRTFARNTDMDFQAWQPAIIFINGTYSGILNIRERANDNNIFTNYDELEDIDAAENWNIKNGTWDNLNAFKAFFNEHGHTYEEYSKWMDVEEFINLYLMDTYFNNIDFPANNLEMWRPRTEDGRWRFIAKDVDYILGIYNQQPYNYQYISWLNNNDFDSNYKWGNTWDGTRLFRRMMEDEDMKRMFTDRLAIYMGDFLNYNRIWEDVWQPMYEKIKSEYPIHRNLVNQWWPNYSDELSSAQNWLKNRTDFMYKHVSDYYKTGTPIPITINKDYAETVIKDIDVTFNGIHLSKSKFDGKFYQGRQVSINAIPSHDATHCIKRWNITVVESNGTVNSTTTTTPEYTFTIPQCSRIVINPIIGTYDDIEAPQIAYSGDGEADIMAIYDSRGVKHNTLQPGINIIHYKDGTTKKIIHKQ